jgi:hypothetical protein
MAIFILYDGVDFSDAINLRNTLNATTPGLNGPATTVPVSTASGPVPYSPVNNDAVIVIWSAVSRGNAALTAEAARMENVNRLIQVAATGESSPPGVIPISDTASIVSSLQQPPFNGPVTPPTPGWPIEQITIVIMATIIFVVLLLIWIAPSDEHHYGDCGASYTEGGYPIEHCPDSYY